MVTARISQAIHKNQVVNFLEHSLSEGKIEIDAYEKLMRLVDVLDPAQEILFEMSADIK
ncbi:MULTISPECIES: hypothetical protein [Paenibacillus]|uniref:hypothetical protein n=1 Tax=Paenibacillus TaxID=44249 RepID=UPI00142D3A55|nr:hypothetical protein [Paenibacillus xylanexedens]